MIDFFSQYFGNIESVYECVCSLMGGYLDRKKILTRDFFSNYDLFDDNVITKF